MSTRFTCDDSETLVAYIYDEIEPGRRDAVARHLGECARCRSELVALGGVRQALTQWTPPAPPLRFSVVQTAAPEPVPDNVIRPAVSSWLRVPVWAQVAAATLAVAVGAAVANVQVRHDPAGWTVSTGWMAPAAPTAPVGAAALDADAAWKPALAALEQSLRAEWRDREAAVRQASAPVAAPDAIPRPASETETLARVRALIETSERRQQRELALRLTQFNRDLDLQRRADLVRIDQGIGQLEGRTGAEVARQRQMLDLIVRAGLRPPQ